MANKAARQMFESTATEYEVNALPPVQRRVGRFAVSRTIVAARAVKIRTADWEAYLLHDSRVHAENFHGRRRLQLCSVHPRDETGDEL